MNTTPTATLKCLVNYFYDLQRLRIATVNRIIRAIEYDDAVLSDKQREWFQLEGDLLKKREHAALLEVKREGRKHPIWPWLESVKGCGPTMSGVIISEFCIHDTREVLNKETGELETRKGAPRPSCFWSYAGLAVDEGAAPKPKKGEKLRYNKWLRTKLVGVLGTSFLKCGSPYRAIYDGYKDRLKAKEWGKSDGHRHNAAIRYMVKMFLLDLWKAWREVENLPIVAPYHEAKLGLKHIA